MSVRTVAKAVAGTIQPAIWEHRKRYAWFVTTVLLGVFAYALYAGKDLNLVTWLLFTMILLVMIGPTAEQFGKWLAQVAAIRSGTRAESDK